MKRIIMGLFVAVLLSGICFASLTNAEKECIKGCCEGVGGTYEWEHNGCESPGGDISACADACREKKDDPCAFLFAFLFVLGAALFAYKE